MDISETSNSSWVRFRWNRLLGSSVTQSSSIPCGFTIPSFRGCTRGFSEKPIVSLSGIHSSFWFLRVRSAGLRERVDERGCPVLLHDLQTSLESRAYSLGGENGPFAVDAEALGQGGEVRRWSLQAHPDTDVLHGALPHLGDRQLVPDILIVGPVVEHHDQHRNVVMRGGPKRARRVQQVPVVLNADADLARPSERQRNAHGHAHPGPRAAASSDEPRCVRHLPESSLPAAQRAVRQNPVLAANRLPDLGGQPSGGDRRLSPPAFPHVLLDASGVSRVDLSSPGGPLRDPPLQIAVHLALTLPSELPQNVRAAPENGDVRGHKPPVATRPAPDSVVLQTHPNELGSFTDDALVAPAVSSRGPRQARRNDAGFRLRARQCRVDVLDANGHDQIRVLQHLDAGRADVQRVPIREIERGTLLDDGQPEELTQRPQRLRSVRCASDSLDQQHRPARLPERPRGVGDRVGVARGRSRGAVAAQVGHDEAVREPTLLELDVEADVHGAPRLGHRDLVGAENGFGDAQCGLWMVVQLTVVTDELILELSRYDSDDTLLPGG